MKIVAEYLDKAIHFEQMAAQEKDAQLKAELLAEAKAYRKFAAQRAARENLPSPSQSN